MKSHKKGACTNEFQIGYIMYTLLQRQFTRPAAEEKQLWKAPFTRNEYSGKYSLGTDLFEDRWCQLYSRELRELVMECMMWEPDDRPSPLDLQKRVAAGRTIALKVCTEEGLFDKNPPVKDFSHVPRIRRHIVYRVELHFSPILCGRII
jgi:hypothetical protein